MLHYVLRRLLQGVLTFAGSTFLVYALTFASRVDPLQALVGERPVPENVRQALTERYHLGEPLVVQYLYFVRGLLRGDLGLSLTGRPINDMLALALGPTAELALLTTALAVTAAVGCGVVAGLRRGGVFDTVTLAGLLVAMAVPLIVSAPLAQLVFGIRLDLIPVTAGAHPGLWALTLPAMVLAWHGAVALLRVTRTSVAENLRQDYVRTARAKGLAPGRVVGIHLLRNALIPVVTLIGLDFGALMGGAVVVEGIFNVPGVGFQILRGIRTEDAPVVVSFVSVLVVVFLVVNLMVDLLYVALDPRIRYER